MWTAGRRLKAAERVDQASNGQRPMMQGGREHGEQDPTGNLRCVAASPTNGSVAPCEADTAQQEITPIPETPPPDPLTPFVTPLCQQSVGSTCPVVANPQRLLQSKSNRWSVCCIHWSDSV